jgi:hypothetical protein
MPPNESAEAKMIAEYNFFDLLPDDATMTIALIVGLKMFPDVVRVIFLPFTLPITFNKVFDGRSETWSPSRGNSS